MSESYTGLDQLGRHAALPASPEEAVLEKVPNPHPDALYVVRFTCPEFTSLCPVTGQPDFAHLVIDYAVALSPDGIVKQVELIEYRESYGEEIHDQSWLKQFAGKTDKDRLEIDRDIRNISGATLSASRGDCSPNTADSAPKSIGNSALIGKEKSRRCAGFFGQ